MYNDITYNGILQKLLDNVTEKVDKREGSIIYNALAPCAMEIAIMYTELNNIILETFADTASREYLILRAKERGLIPKPATRSILKGEFNMNIPLESRFSLGNLTYKAIKKIEDNNFQMQCEQFGVIGNKNTGELIPVEYIDGLTKATLTEVLIPGQDEEETEVFRARYFNSFETKSYGGNVKDYLEKTNSIDGVGATKVTPVWNGGGTVKLTIIDSEFNKASEELIEKVQEEIDPSKDGTGGGIAPIGHIVTVDTVTEIVVNISTNITFSEGNNFLKLQSKITQIVNAYLLELRKDWANQSNLTVRISQIDAKILSIDGIIDITNTRINGTTSNLLVTKYQIPKLGEITNGD